MSAEPFIARVDALTRSLNPAVQKAGSRGDGAEFAWLLSVISESGDLAERIERNALPAPKTVDLGHYTPEVVGRLNEALLQGRSGELGLMLSWLDTAPVRPRMRQPQDGNLSESESAGGVSMAKAALLGRHAYAQSDSLLEEISQSRLRERA